MRFLRTKFDFTHVSNPAKSDLLGSYLFRRVDSGLEAVLGVQPIFSEGAPASVTLLPQVCVRDSAGTSSHPPPEESTQSGMSKPIQELRKEIKQS